MDNNEKRHIDPSKMSCDTMTISRQGKFEAVLCKKTKQCRINGSMDDLTQDDIADLRRLTRDVFQWNKWHIID